MEVLGWIIAHSGQIATALTALHTLAVVIVNLTPTPVDNRLYGKFYRVIEAIAGIVTAAAKQKGHRP